MAANRTVINSSRVTALRSSMSHAVRAGGMAYVSGAVPFRGEREIARGDFPAQCRQVMENIAAVLEACGSSLALAVKFNVALRDMAYFREFDTIFRGYFAEGNLPARMTTESPHLPHPDFMLTVDCTAVCAED